ncbi:MAG TPA: hypothetical protein VN841_19615 [Bryobacteraceae bacterium]|nr:hypothetical protein [Bryobacteraceae bacterium]
MAKIHAGFSELKASHLRLVASAKSNEGPPAHLLLFYAAECGLKYVHLRRNNFRTTEQLRDANHDLNLLIKDLNLSASAIGGAPALRLSRGEDESCPPASAHQAWRYGVRIDATDEARFVAWLQRICEVVVREYL